MKRILALFILAATAHAQNVPQMTNAVSIGVEGITITADSAPNPLVVQICYQSACSPAQTPKLPLVVNCSSATLCKLLGGDPAVGDPKTLYVQQQATAFTVTLAGVPIPVPIPAIAQPVVTPPVTPPAKSYTFGYTMTLDPTGKVIGATCAAPVIQ